MDTDHQLPAMEKPLPFIIMNEAGTLEMNKEVIDLLKDLAYPVTSIAIAGKYRTGKSHLMNRLIGEKSGFPLGHSVQAQTKGIWLWARPHPEDKNRCMILLDTEGLYDPEKGDETYDLKVFALSLLLSSYFIFNVVGTIDEAALQQLHLVSELTKHIHTGRSEGQTEETGEDFSRYFPDFAIVLRDFYLDLRINGQPCTADEYLEHSLKLKPGKSERVKNYNRPRECLRDYFPERRCFTLPRPKENVMKLEEALDSELSPDFLSKVDEAIKTILREAGIFKINADVITVKRFMSLAEMYVDALNQGGVPNIESSVELLKRKECQEALDEAIKQYKAYMQSDVTSRMPVSGEELSACHKEGSGQALETFHKMAWFDDDGVYVKRFMEDIQRSYEEVLRTNGDKSKEKCQLLLSEYFGSVSNNIQGKVYTTSGGYEKYKAEKDAAIKQYQTTANKGPLADKILEEYLKSKESEENTILQADQALSSREKELAEEQARRQQQEQAAKAEAAKNAELVRKISDEQANNKEVIRKMEEDFQRKYQEEQKQQDEIIAQKEKEFEKLKQEGSDKAAEYERQLQNLVAEKTDLDKTVANMQSNIDATQRQYSELLAQLTNQKSNDDATIQALQAQINTLQAQVNARHHHRRRRRRKKFGLF